MRARRHSCLQQNRQNQKLKLGVENNSRDQIVSAMTLNPYIPTVFLDLHVVKRGAMFFEDWKVIECGPTPRLTAVQSHLVH